MYHRNNVLFLPIQDPITLDYHRGFVNNVLFLPIQDPITLDYHRGFVSYFIVLYNFRYFSYVIGHVFYQNQNLHIFIIYSV